MEYKAFNQHIGSYLKEDYSVAKLSEIYNLLCANDTFAFNALANGLFPAATVVRENEFTNYDKVWVRDNIYVANAFYEYSEIDKARKVIYAIGDFYIKYKHRLINIINGVDSPDDVMKRPHIRFEGSNLEELGEEWAHAENDALGYYLWLLLKMANNGDVKFRKQEIELVPLLVKYFRKINYWQDADSGHWEETRKIETSSIGVVVVALHELSLYHSNPVIPQTEKNLLKQDTSLIKELLQEGIKALMEILPLECKQKDKKQYREVDAAQLFLIYPLDLFDKVVQDKVIEDTILKNVRSKLQGEVGIRRYLGDSFWTADTKKKQEKTEITADYSNRIEERDKNHVLGEEAQWCIFDPIVSIIYGERFLKHKREEDYQLQVHYFNRSLSHITGDDCKYGAFKCPELYYLEDGEYVNNDTVPLLWTQANLWLACKTLKRSIQHTNTIVHTKK